MAENNEYEENQGRQLDLYNQGLDILPISNENWGQATLVILGGNQIEEFDAGQLPPTLTYLDLSDNPLRTITGEFNTPVLRNLILSRTTIHKLPVLPPSLEELIITDTPMAEKYSIRAPVIDKNLFKRLSNFPFISESKEFAPFDIMIDDTPISLAANTNESDNNTNASEELPDAYKIVMLLAKRETDEDIIYNVRTLYGVEKEVHKELLRPYLPKYADTVVPAAITNPLSSYIINAHGGDTLFEKPVPPNCVYITLEECGLTTKHVDYLSAYLKLMQGFNNIPEGMLEKLNNPVRYRHDLMAHFGRSLHIHWAEAPDEERASKTYTDALYSPWLGWNHGEDETCELHRSGIHALIPGEEFKIKEEEGDHGRKIYVSGMDADSRNIPEETLHYMYDKSLFPTFNMVKDEHSLYDEGPILYSNMNNYLRKFEFTQSWAFKMFPGIHYNFSCRSFDSKNIDRNENIEIRRSNSVNAKLQNIKKLSDADIRGELGSRLLETFTEDGQVEMLQGLIERGIDVSRLDKRGVSLLEKAVGNLQIPVVKLLMKVPNTIRVLEGGGFEKILAVLYRKRQEEVANIKVKYNAPIKDRKIAEIIEEVEMIESLLRTPPPPHANAASAGGKRKTRLRRTRRYKKTRRVRRNR